MRFVRSILVVLAFAAPLLATADDPKPKPRPPQPAAPAAQPAPARPSVAPAPIAPARPAVTPAAPSRPSYEPAPSRPSYAPAPASPSRPSYAEPPPQRAPMPLPSYSPSARPATPQAPQAAPATPPAVAPHAIEPKVIELHPSGIPGAELGRAPAQVRPDDLAGVRTPVPSGATDLRRSPAGRPMTDREPSTHPLGDVSARPRTPADIALEHPRGVVQPYDGRESPPPGEHHHDRPDPRYVSPPPYAPYAPPGYYWYRPWYTSWYCHPYWRYTHPTWSVVWFGFDVYPWDPWWVPPARYGWTWVPGYWYWGSWVPGYWAPLQPVPVHYVYVPGAWYDTVYVEGHYRVQDRPDWEWVDGYYLDDGTWIPGTWRPTRDGPDGYVWEAGFWDGEDWVDGFWRPEYRSGYTWVSSYYDAEGTYNAGYWLPLEKNPGHTWIPGWFDGKKWVEGYWVDDAALTPEKVKEWKAPAGVDSGFKSGDAPTIAEPDGLPLALPVDPTEGTPGG